MVVKETNRKEASGWRGQESFPLFIHSVGNGGTNDLNGPGAISPAAFIKCLFTVCLVWCRTFSFIILSIPIMALHFSQFYREWAAELWLQKSLVCLTSKSMFLTTALVTCRVYLAQRPSLSKTTREGCRSDRTGFINLLNMGVYHLDSLSGGCKEGGYRKGPRRFGFVVILMFNCDKEEII